MLPSSKCKQSSSLKTASVNICERRRMTTKNDKEPLPFRGCEILMNLAPMQIVMRMEFQTLANIKLENLLSSCKQNEVLPYLFTRFHESDSQLPSPRPSSIDGHTHSMHGNHTGSHALFLVATPISGGAERVPEFIRGETQRGQRT